MTSAFDLHTTALHLHRGQSIRASEATSEFWVNTDRPEFRNGRILSVFSYSHTWNYQELHPEGDELSVLLDGHVELLMVSGNGEEAVTLRSGWGYVIPAGVWHRVRVHEPSTLLFITPTPARTQHQRLPADHDENPSAPTR